MHISRPLKLAVSSLALAVGSVFAIGAANQASAATIPQERDPKLTDPGPGSHGQGGRHDSGGQSGQSPQSGQSGQSRQSGQSAQSAQHDSGGEAGQSGERPARPQSGVQPQQPPGTVRIVPFKFDGCSVSDPIRPKTKGSNFDFTQACYNHDRCYYDSGAVGLRTEAIRRKCDKKFFLDMMKDCNSRTPVLGCTKRARAYLAGVRLCGGPSYWAEPVGSKPVEICVKGVSK